MAKKVPVHSGRLLLAAGRRKPLEEVRGFRPKKVSGYVKRLGRKLSAYSIAVAAHWYRIPFAIRLAFRVVLALLVWFFFRDLNIDIHVWTSKLDFELGS